MKRLGKPVRKILDLAVYWIKERDSIWRKRHVKKLPPPWTSDPVMEQYSWTNTTRRKDRGTLIMYRDVYGMWKCTPGFGDRGRADLLIFNVCLYRIFNRVDTWRAIVKALGKPLAPDWSAKTRRKVLRGLERYRDEQGGKVFTQAYMTWGGGNRRKIGSGNKPKFYVNERIADLWERLPAIDLSLNFGAQEPVFDEISKALAFGPFIASQIVFDLTYTCIMGTLGGLEPAFYETDDDTIVGWEVPRGKRSNIQDLDTWVMCGPGARLFLRLLWPDEKFGKPEEMIEGTRAFWRALQRKSKHPAVQDLDLHDAENALCECWKFYKLTHTERRFNPRRFHGKGDK